MISDPQFWVAIAFVIFLLAIFNPVRKLLSSSLDSKIDEIKKNIEDTENLKNESQETLSNIKKRQNEVELEIKEIYDNANTKIKINETQEKSKLSEQIDKRELLANLKIDQMTRDANLLVKQHISQTAIQSTVALIQKKLNQNEKQNLINQSIKDLGNILQN